MRGSRRGILASSPVVAPGGSWASPPQPEFPSQAAAPSRSMVPRPVTGCGGSPGNSQGAMAVSHSLRYGL
ncbi:hypothetical protein [Streptomyces sp. KL2]|uniref:hypothetical protein n=1 Tax=Streptomyces sp. KL2 TaxID=3050126 RepID=UPI00397D0C72